MMPMLERMPAGLLGEVFQSLRSQRRRRSRLLPCYWPEAENLPRTTASGVPMNHRQSLPRAEPAPDLIGGGGCRCHQTPRAECVRVPTGCLSPAGALPRRERTRGASPYLKL